MEKAFPSVIKLNVGGLEFVTRLSTLRKYPDSMLAAMFSGRHETDQDGDGYYFIDRNGQHFAHILEFLRDDQYLPPKKIFEEVLKDAEYFCVFDLVNRLKGLPPLFPLYTIHEENRKTIKTYFSLKERVIEIAKSGAPNNESKFFDISTSEVVVNSLKITVYTKADFEPFGPGIQHVHSNEDIYKPLTESNYKNVTMFINSEEVRNLKGFVSTLLVDLQQEGYVVDPSFLSDLEASKGRKPQSKHVIYNQKGYSVEDSVTLRFEWS